MSWDFKFSCGCIFPRESCERKWINTYKSWHYICPKHHTKGIMKYRISVCELCLQKFKVQSKGQVPKICYKCKDKETQKEEKPITIPPLSNPNTQANIDRSDCIHRINECLLDPKYALTSLPCRTCTKYEPQTDRPIQFAYRGQNDWLDP